VSIRILEASGDAIRWQIREFLQKSIDNGPIEPILSVRGESLHDRPTEVLRISDAKGITAAIHFGRPYAEAEEFTLASGYPATSARLLEQTRMLHSIAVRPDRRRSGLGHALLDEAESRATSAGALIIFGIASGSVDADEFYLGRGYRVGPSGTPLELKLGSQVMVFPLVMTESRWFVKIIGQPPQRRRRLFLKPKGIYAGAVFMSPNEID
jgi:GNAT superfamily N-acetyltransferase